MTVSNVYTEMIKKKTEIIEETQEEHENIRRERGTEKEKKERLRCGKQKTSTPNNHVRTERERETDREKEWIYKFQQNKIQKCSVCSVVGEKK